MMDPRCKCCRAYPVPIPGEIANLDGDLYLIEFPGCSTVRSALITGEMLVRPAQVARAAPFGWRITRRVDDTLVAIGRGPGLQVLG